VATHDQDTAVTNVNEPVEVELQRDCLIVVYHRDKEQQGRRLELAESRVRIGRETDNDLVLLDEGVSRHHARIESHKGAWLAMDVGSRNGTLLNNEPLRGVKRLKNGDLLKLGGVIVKYLSGQDLESSLYEEMFQLAVTDGLTHLANRRRFDEELNTETARVRRHGRELSLIMLDIDDFKGVNDRYGHAAGDAVLFRVAQLILERVRGHDLAARVGGEELSVLMPETNLQGARVLGEELRRAIEHSAVDFAEQHVRVTVSIGCAQFSAADADPGAFVRRCDAQLYAAKAAGKNRVCG
jgi:diguanylate cyclase (GGDEF)-like protein